MPTPTIGPTTDTGFPTSILGLAVHSVAGIYQLAAAGRLDGRLAAVGGYWVQYALPCPYMPHLAALDGFCYGGRFADTPEGAVNMNGPGSNVAPIAVPETANGNQLWSAGGVNGGAAMVVLIVHAADSRTWQCQPQDRNACLARLVIDSVAWVNGDAMQLNLDTSGLSAVALTLDDVIAAGVKPGEQLVTAYPLRATDVNDVDPRLLGQGSDIVWYLRALTGAPDADGISDGVVRLLSDSSSSIAAELPLVMSDEHQLARLILDSDQNSNLPSNTYPYFALLSRDTTLVGGPLGSSTTPVVLEAGDYVLRAWLADSNGQPADGPTCDASVSFDPGSLASYFATFTGASCQWSAGELHL